MPVACVDDLETYGFLPAISQEDQRSKILDRFARLYSPAIGTGPVMDYLGQTGLDSLAGADILKVAPERYSSTVEYADTTIAGKLKGIAQVHMAGLGARVFYCDQGSYDSHASQMGMHAGLIRDASDAIGDFFQDLREHDARRQRHHAHLLRVRPQDPRQRLGHRPRRRRPPCWSSATG